MTSPDSGSTTTREDVKINRRDEILRKIPIPELLDIVDRSNPNSIIDEFIKIFTELLENELEKSKSKIDDGSHANYAHDLAQLFRQAVMQLLEEVVQSVIAKYSQNPEMSLLLDGFKYFLEKFQPQLDHLLTWFCNVTFEFVKHYGELGWDFVRDSSIHVYTYTKQHFKAWFKKLHHENV